MIAQKIPPVVLDVLKRSTIDGNVLTLPQQLDRLTYQAVAEVITNCGGKWKNGSEAPATSSPLILARNWVWRSKRERP